MRKQNFAIPLGLILLQSLLYGFGDPISKAAYAVLPVYSLLTARYGIALGFLLLFFGRRVVAGLRACSPRDWLLPSLCIGAAYLVGNLAIELTAATAVAFLRSLSTLMTPLLALAVFHRPFGKKHVPVQLLVLVGLYLLCGLGGLSQFGWGEVCALLCALLLAASLIFGEHALERVDPVTLTTVQAGASALMALAYALVFERGIHLSAATPGVWAIIVYLALACTVAGYFLQNRALGSISARTVTLLQCVCPVMTALFSRLVLGESLTVAGLVGAAIILLCVVLETGMKEEGALAVLDEAAAYPPVESQKQEKFP